MKKQIAAGILASLLSAAPFPLFAEVSFTQETLMANSGKSTVAQRIIDDEIDKFSSSSDYGDHIIDDILGLL